ncbi:MAG: hypothetical protein OXU36_22515 [Candidatus Poribacteria bacterium]|nr:hypothetical protein [Candidatus Poribacteria bacterium]
MSLKSNCLVNNSDGVEPHKRIDALTWAATELRDGKRMHIRKFPKGY